MLATRITKEITEGILKEAAKGNSVAGISLEFFGRVHNENANRISKIFPYEITKKIIRKVQKIPKKFKDISKEITEEKPIKFLKKLLKTF